MMHRPIMQMQTLLEKMTLDFVGSQRRVIEAVEANHAAFIHTMNAIDELAQSQLKLAQKMKEQIEILENMSGNNSEERP